MTNEKDDEGGKVNIENSQGQEVDEAVGKAIEAVKSEASLTGLYECLLTKSLRDRLVAFETSTQAAGEDADLLFALLYRHAAQALRRALAAVFEKEGEKKASEAAKALLQRVMHEVESTLQHEGLGSRTALDASFDPFVDPFVDPFSILLAADDREPRPGVTRWCSLERPATSFSQTALFTGARGEPVLLDELRRETLSAQSADWLVSFLKMSGLRPLMQTLHDFTARGGKLRVITTTYVGATDPEAVLWLAKLPNTEVYVSYDGKETRHHAKSYLFHRPHGLSTAYAGSANLSHAALSYGLEWTVKVTEASDPVLLERMRTIFAAYLTDSKRFERFDADRDETRLREAIQKAKAPRKQGENEMLALSAFGIRIEPYPFQRAILDKLEAARTLHHETRSLVVAATGTGKTMIAAFDYRRQVESKARFEKRPIRLLFVAHREEILRQASSAFRYVMNDMNFGELFTGNETPKEHNHVFMSVQTANARDVSTLYPADHFDYIVVDEFHHAEAESYRKLLDYFKPKLLLGLTATPYRGDGRDVLARFGGHVSAELLLGDAIDQQLLVPFEYLMVTDPVSLAQVEWRKGAYDTGKLEALYTKGTTAAQRDQALVDAIKRYLPDLADVRGLIFCVSRAHAEHVTALLQSQGVPTETIDGSTDRDVRRSAPGRLRDGTTRFISTVDVYNEGVDIPEINTVLFLRPTASPTIFLQQLGRGLRLCEGKLRLTVLDFVGQARKEFSFANRLALLLRERQTNPAALKAFVESPDASLLPLGCTLTLEKQAMAYVLENLGQQRRTRQAFLEGLRAWTEETQAPWRMRDYLATHELRPADWPGLVKNIVPGRESVFFEDVLSLVRPADEGYQVLELPEAFELKKVSFNRRFFRKNGLRSIEGLLADLSQRQSSLQSLDASFDALSTWSKNNWVMLAYTFFDAKVKDLGGNEAAARYLYRTAMANAALKTRIIGALEALREDIDFVSPPATATAVPSGVPLELHAYYSAREAAAAFGNEKAYSLREGVVNAKDGRPDLFFVTITKEERHFAVSQRYNDYAMNANFFHWETQSKTREASEQGRRYKRIDFRSPDAPEAHLFIREKKEEGGGAAPFVYLGRVCFVSSHGECPMSIVWELETPIPAKWLDRFVR